jgi:hypothetical protein
MTARVPPNTTGMVVLPGENTEKEVGSGVRIIHSVVSLCMRHCLTSDSIFKKEC